MAPVDPFVPLPGFARLIAPDCALTRRHLVSCWRPEDSALIERVRINTTPREWRSIELVRELDIVCGVDQADRFECFAAGAYARSVSIVNAWIMGHKVSDFVSSGRSLELIVDGHLVSTAIPRLDESVVGVDLDALGEPTPRYVRYSETSRDNQAHPLLRSRFAIDEAGAVSAATFEMEPGEEVEFVSLAHGRFESCCGVTRDARGVCFKNGELFELSLPGGEGVRQIVPRSGLESSSFEMYVVAESGRVFEATLGASVSVHEEPIVDPIANRGDKDLVQIYAGEPSCGLIQGEHAIACFGTVGEPAWLEEGATDSVTAPVLVADAPAFESITSSDTGDRHCAQSVGGDVYCWGRGQAGATKVDDFKGADALFIGPREVMCGYWREERSFACEVRALSTPTAQVLDREVASFAVHRDAWVALFEDGELVEFEFNGSSYNERPLSPPEPLEMMTATVSLVCGVGRVTGQLYCGQDRDRVWAWRQIDVPTGERGITFLASSSSSALVAPAPPSTLCVGDDLGQVVCAKVPVDALSRDDFEGFDFLELEVPRMQRYVGGVVSAQGSCVYDEALTLSCEGVDALARFGDRFSEVSLGVETRCGLDESGQAWCWGSDALSGALGRGLPLEVNQPRVALGWDDLFGP